MIEMGSNPLLDVTKRRIQEKGNERELLPVEDAAANFFALQVPALKATSPWASFYDSDTFRKLNTLFRTHPEEKSKRRQIIDQMQETFKGARADIKHQMPLLVVAEIVKQEFDNELEPIISFVVGENNQLIGGYITTESAAYCVAPTGFFKINSTNETGVADQIDPRQFADIAVGKIKKQLTTKGVTKYYTNSADKIDEPRTVYVMDGQPPTNDLPEYGSTQGAMNMVANLIELKK